MQFPKTARLAGPCAAALVAACATLPPVIPGSQALAECRAHFIALDEQTDEDGIRDAGAYRIPGFPYLRSNRFLASFVGGLDTGRFNVWVQQLRRYGLESRAIELRNLGEDKVSAEIEQLDRCGAGWLAHDLADPARRLALLKAVEVPDDYSTWKRFFGLYTFTAPFMKMGINKFNGTVREDFAKPLEQLDAPGSLVLWQPPAQGAATPREIAWWLANPPPDALGIPHLSDEQWWRMASTYAPLWWVESGGEFDRPGTLGLNHGAPVLDPAQPAVYFLPSFTRFGGRVLPQLVYVMWFSERPKKGWLDAYGGALDGVVWRVTLDTDGTPLVYDTIHPCGCYHEFFPVKDLPRRPRELSWKEAAVIPQKLSPAGRVAVRVQSATHYVRRVVEPTQTAGEVRGYRLLDYRDLLSLPDGDRHRSLFCADGIVCGTARLERYWLWISGVDSPGAMRQWGRHATAFVGRRHFDDADLLEKLFVSP